MLEGGGNCLKYLERGWDRKERRKHKNFKEVGALKRGAGTLLRTMISYKKDNFLLGLTLHFQISFVLHLDEAVYILNKPLPLSVWVKQLPPYTIGCKTQIALVFKDISKAATISFIIFWDFLMFCQISPFTTSETMGHYYL